MASDGRSGRRERAETYAQQAAEAARRGDHRKAAVLYQAAFIALEGNAEGEKLDDLAFDDPPQAQPGEPGQMRAETATDRPDEAD